MGKVSVYFVVIGLSTLAPAIILTIIPTLFPASIPNIFSWVGIVIAFVIGLLYVVAFGLIVLGLIIKKRDEE